MISSSASLRAEDESARMATILEQVTQTLDQAELPDEAKQAILRDLKKSLSEAFADDAVGSKPEAADTEATQDRRDRPRQRARAAQREQRQEQRREPSRDSAAEARRAETPRDEPERQRQPPTQDSAPQPTRYAIGVMLEQPEESDANGQLLITDVFPGSPAAQAGLKSGDVIRKVDGEKLTDANGVTQRVDQAGLDDKPLSLEIGRGEDVLTVEVKPSPRPGAGGGFGFGGPDWAFPALPGMPGFGGWRDPQWRFPTPPQGADTDRIAEVIKRIERQEKEIKQMRQTVEKLRKQLAEEPETEGDNSDDD